MEYTVLIILIALLQYIYFLGKVAYYRGKLDVHAPKTVGNDVWERIYRVQQNTTEQLIIFIPALFLFSEFVSSTWVILPGIAYLLGRVLYSIRYVKNPNSRGLGMALSIFSSFIMIIVTLIKLLLDNGVG